MIIKYLVKVNNQLLQLFFYIILEFALTEAIGLFALMMAFLLLKDDSLIGKALDSKPRNWRFKSSSSCNKIISIFNLFNFLINKVI